MRWGCGKRLGIVVQFFTQVDFLRKNSQILFEGSSIRTGR
jgi:hypothetical protein